VSQSTTASDIQFPAGSVTGQTRPLLRWDIRLHAEDGGAVLELGEDEYRLAGVPPDSVERVLAKVDGHRTIAEVATSAKIALPVATAVVAALIAYKLAVDVEQVGEPDLDSNRFFGICRDMFPVWKARLFSHPLWVGLATGVASRTQFMGWLLESYHFIEGANDRMSLAVAECSHKGIRNILARHYVEEWDHGAFFLKSLNAFGLSSEVVFAARPLPATLSVLNFMRYCARRGPLYYAVCSGFLESTGTDRAKAREFYERLERHYAPTAPEVIKPMADHTDLDEAYGHGDMLEAISENIVKISYSDASDILQACATFVEVLELWSSDILRTYSQPGARPRVDHGLYRMSDVTITD